MQNGSFAKLQQIAVSLSRRRTVALAFCRSRRPESSR
jgi:hypothetical protein